MGINDLIKQHNDKSMYRKRKDKKSQQSSFNIIATCCTESLHKCAKIDII